MIWHIIHTANAQDGTHTGGPSTEAGMVLFKGNLYLAKVLRVEKSSDKENLQLKVVY